MSKANLANAILAAPIDTSATSATLVTGYGAIMPPSVPFKMTLTPFGQLSTRGNSEIVLVTAVTGEVLTIERAKGGTTAKAFEAGDIISNGIYIENSTAVGDIFMSLRETPEAGRLFMAGGTFNKADYPLLYKCVSDNAAYGTTTSTTFTLSDMRERMPFGKSSNAPFTTLGNMGGATTHTLTQAQIPNFTGKIILHSGERGSQYVSGDGVFRNSIQDVRASYIPAPATSSGSQSFYGNINFDLGGGGQSHPIMNPYMVVNYEVICG